MDFNFCVHFYTFLFLCVRRIQNWIVVDATVVVQFNFVGNNFWLLMAVACCFFNLCKNLNKNQLTNLFCNLKKVN